LFFVSFFLILYIHVAVGIPNYQFDLNDIIHDSYAGDTQFESRTDVFHPEDSIAVVLIHSREMSEH
jgi:hypothetical protein